MADAPEHTADPKLLAALAKQLSPLYGTAAVDAPENLLSHYPRAKRIISAQKRLLELLFPGAKGDKELRGDALERFFAERLSDAWNLLLPEITRALPFRWLGAAAQADGVQALAAEAVPAEAERVLAEFLGRIPAIREYLVDDIKAAYDGDPAAHSYAEVIIAYPGVLAVASHRLAHELYRLNVPIVPRVMSEWTHTKTGADIHPGATIGRGFFIDHPTGVVIGETASIGDRVKFYQGVTIGAKSFPLDHNGRPIKHIKRHPTVEDNVVVYANATLLGGDTVIGAGSTIGGNVFLMESVPPESVVINTAAEPEIKVRKKSSVPGTEKL